MSAKGSPQQPNLNQLRIGTRLTISFVTIVALMVVGYSITLWQFNLIRRESHRLDHVDQESLAVLRVHANVLLFRDKLEDLVATQDAERLALEAIEFRKRFQEVVERAKLALESPSPDSSRDPTTLSTLEVVEGTLSTQISAMTNLAAAGDWRAVQLRLENQEKELSFLTTSLVEKVDNQVTQERAQALENIQRVQRRVFLVLGLTAGLTLLLAGELGLSVTRSITQPLALLDVSAQALARGEFQHQVTVTGKDELATLGRAFNHATRQLRELYEALRISESRFRSLIENSYDLVMIVDGEGIVRYVSPSSERVIGLKPESLLEKSIFEFVDSADLASARNIFSGQIATTSPAVELRFRHADGTLRILEVIANNLLDEPAIEGVVVNARDVTDRKRSEEAVRQLSTRMLRIQEEEQRRIARDVHDSTSQEITALTLNLGALRKSKEGFSSNAREKVAESLALAKRIARQIRTFSYLLHPPMLDEFGLWAALRIFIEEFRSRSGLHVTLQIKPELEGLRLDPNCEMALFRLVQEALANVHRHAGSRTAAVSIEPQEHFIKASIADAGRGIPLKVLKEINASGGRFLGVGISGMKERVRQVGGHLDIQSGSEGTTVTALIPADEIEPRPAQTFTQDLSQRN